MAAGKTPAVAAPYPGACACPAGQRRGQGGQGGGRGSLQHGAAVDRHGLIVRMRDHFVAHWRAQRDGLGRITVQLKNHTERLAVSQAWAWRFKPM